MAHRVGNFASYTLDVFTPTWNTIPATDTEKDDSASTCNICKKKILLAQYDMLELKFHGDCFRCKKCNTRLSYITANRVGSEVFCDDHANRRLMFFVSQMQVVSHKQIYTDMTILCTNSTTKKKTRKM